MNVINVRIVMAGSVVDLDCGCGWGVRTTVSQIDRGMAELRTHLEGRHELPKKRDESIETDR